MKKRIFIMSLGVLTMCLLSTGCLLAVISRPVEDDVYYYIKVDTASKDIGYLRVFDTNKVGVDPVKGDSSLWKFTTQGTLNYHDFYIINKATGDMLAFDMPDTDEPAVIAASPIGILNIWYNLVFDSAVPDMLRSDLNLGTQKFYLTCQGNEIKISPESSSLARISFQIEMQERIYPDPDLFYRIKIDTTRGSKFIPAGYLRPDTLQFNSDSLVVDTVTNGYSQWKFTIDAYVNDTALFKIENRETGKLLSFNIPQSDTIASVANPEGVLNQWIAPFYPEGKGIEKLMTYNPATKEKFFLGIRPDSTVMLIRDTVAVKYMSFLFEETPPIQYQFDSAGVYTIQYLNAGKFLGVDFTGDTILLDAVLANVPDGQFVVNKQNTRGLLNRTRPEQPTDTLHIAYDDSGIRMPDRYYFKTDAGNDTVEVKAITDASLKKTNPDLGYKYFEPSDLRAFCYYFVYTPTDTLENRILGIDTLSADTAVLLFELDTATFIVEAAGPVMTGAPAIGDEIAQLRKQLYRLRSMNDTTLYLSWQSPSRMTDESAGYGLFFLKENGIDEEYNLMLYERAPAKKMVVDSISKRLIHASIDTTANSFFRIVQAERPLTHEPDTFEYLTWEEFRNDIFKGKGFYEFRVGTRWLTKNFYNYAVLGREGESMLRSGSYTPYDLQLWADTARGPGFNPDKPSFYIVKDVDTAATAFDGFRASGFFLHVLDSTSLAEHADYVAEVDEKEYNRVNFVEAQRNADNELELLPSLRKLTEPEINEYRFYIQHSDKQGIYYLVTEAGYGDGGRTNARGYLSIKYDTVYVGPRKDALEISFLGSTVANETIRLVPLADNNDVAVWGGTGQMMIRNGDGQNVAVYSVLGRQILQRVLGSDFVAIPASRGIYVVKVGDIARKVVVN